VIPAYEAAMVSGRFDSSSALSNPRNFGKSSYHEDSGKMIDRTREKAAHDYATRKVDI
jgi:hypothetical protein